MFSGLGVEAGCPDVVEPELEGSALSPPLPRPRSSFVLVMGLLCPKEALACVGFRPCNTHGALRKRAFTLTDTERCASLEPG